MLSHLSIPMTNDVQTAVRLPASVLRAVDRMARDMTRSGGIKVTRAALIRMMIVQGVKR